MYKYDTYFLNIRGRLCRGLHEDEAMLSGKCLTLFSFYVSPSLKVTECQNKTSCVA